MIAKGGDRLLREDAIATIRTELLRLAEVVTPNVPKRKCSRTAQSRRRRHARRGRRIRDLGARVVVVKGGHLDSGARRRRRRLHAGRIVRAARPAHRHAAHARHGLHVRGGGLPRGWRGGDALDTAIRGARVYLEGAIRHAPGLGGGHGPLGHFWAGY
jgi:hydroxymethylpyrimidine/phosphomethylpyrimidine kinase